MCYIFVNPKGSEEFQERTLLSCLIDNSSFQFLEIVFSGFFSHELSRLRTNRKMYNLKTINLIGLVG